MTTVEPVYLFKGLMTSNLKDGDEVELTTDDRSHLPTFTYPVLSRRLGKVMGQHKSVASRTATINRMQSEEAVMFHHWPGKPVVPRDARKFRVIRVFTKLGERLPSAEMVIIG